MFRHLVECHKEVAVRCEICGEWNPEDMAFEHKRNIHVRAKKREDERLRKENMTVNYFCDLCDLTVAVPCKVDDVEMAKKKHMVERHSKDILACECGVEVWKKAEAEQHAKEHPASQLFPVVSKITPSCPTCELKFIDDDGNMSEALRCFWLDNKKFVNGHLSLCGKTVGHRQPYECKLCGAEFRKYRLHRHNIESHREMLRHCDVCGVSLFRKLLRSHRFSVHGIRMKPVQEPRKKKESDKVLCSLCGKSFVSSFLELHQLSCKKKLEEPTIACQFCHKIVKRRQLSQHEIFHIEEKETRTCEYCGKEMNLKTYRRHIHNHKISIERASRGPQPKKECPICFKKFALRKYLYNHMSTHTQKYRVQCPHCGGSYSGKRNLERHIKLHCLAKTNKKNHDQGLITNE